MTEVNEVVEFYEAEEYHHNYFKNNPNNSYCQIVVSPKLKNSIRNSLYLEINQTKQFHKFLDELKEEVKLKNKSKKVKGLGKLAL